jgi:putative CAP-gly domain containing protein
MSETMELIVSYEAKTADNQILTTNFEEIKASVAMQVEKYSIEVTDENIPEAKKVMANFNKVKAAIGDRYKFFIDKLSAPINQLKTEKKEIEAIITDGRQKIADGVAAFENAKLEQIAERINEYARSLCDEKGLNFERINVSDLIKLSAVTAAGSLAKPTKEAIEGKIATLENEILQAKLAEQEKQRRDAEIAERARKEAEERAAREKAELEAQAKAREAEILARAERERQEAAQRAEREKQEAVEQAAREAAERAKTEANKQAFYEAQREVLQKPRDTGDGKVIYTIRAEFEVKAIANASHEKLAAKIKDMLAAAGITNLSKIEVLNA